MLHTFATFCIKVIKFLEDFRMYDNFLFLCLGDYYKTLMNYFDINENYSDIAIFLKNKVYFDRKYMTNLPLN